jgi:hypothetical protein
MMCEERAGFLFAHACDQMSVWGCARCTKPICAAHTRTTAQGPACIACARAIESEQRAQAQEQQSADQQGTGQPARDEPGVGPPADDRQAYSDTDDPYFYRRGPSGSREHYDADDRRAFDSSANQEPEGSWEQDPAGS